MEYIHGEYFLNEEESRAFLKSVFTPDESVMGKRDAYFAKIDSSLSITYTDNGGMLVDSPEIRPSRKSSGSFKCYIYFPGSCGSTWSDPSDHGKKVGRYVSCAAG